MRQPFQLSPGDALPETLLRALAQSVAIGVLSNEDIPDIREWISSVLNAEERQALTSWIKAVIGDD